MLAPNDELVPRLCDNILEAFSDSSVFQDLLSAHEV